MKKFFSLSLVTMSALFVLTIFSLMQNTPAGYLVPVNEEIYTAGDFDQLRIRKTYCLSPSDTPNAIPTEDFEQARRHYHLLELTKEEISGEVLYVAIFADSGTPYSDTSKMTFTQR